MSTSNKSRRVARHFALHWLSNSPKKASRWATEALRIAPPSRQRPTRKRKLPTHIRMVRDGNFYRLPTATQGKAPKLPIITTKASPTVSPKVAMLPKSPPSTACSTVVVGSSTGYCWMFLKWFRANLPVLMLNFGSICILVGFARSDVLELRALTMTGQLTFAAYNLGQATILWPSVVWSGIFASVNGYKIMNVFQERTAEIHMTSEQERIFVDYFMNHGITPLQFSWIEEKAKVLRIEPGDSLIRKGEQVDRVFLVVEGSTHAHILGRRLTAASTNPNTRGDQLQGGDSGAWIGEMAFLEWLHQTTGSESKEDASEDNKGRLGRGVAMYTIVTKDGCKVLSWTHAEMAELMEASTDLRSALTRAMTAAVVGKVVNLTTSNPKGEGTNAPKRGWTRWLSNWKRSDGASVKLADSVPK